MKSILLMTVLALWFAAVSHASTTCTTADGKVRYEQVVPSYGTPPPPGSLLSTTRIQVDGVVVSESKSYVERDPETGPLEASFSETKELSFAAGNARTLRYFTAVLRLSTQTNSTLALSVPLPFAEFVLCREVTWLVP